MYGVYVHYFSHGYDLSAHDFLYGEHTTQYYSAPKEMIIMVEIQNESLLLSKFGIMTDADMVAIIPIDSFSSVWGGASAEPKSGDLIMLTELGWGRPGGYTGPTPDGAAGAGTGDMGALTAFNSQCDSLMTRMYYCASDPNYLNEGDRAELAQLTAINAQASTTSGYNPLSAWNAFIRGAPIYEITERRDDMVTQGINVLQGHYVWFLKCKRFVYSYEHGIRPEPGSQQPSDETFTGMVSGPVPDEFSEPKKYQQNIDDKSKEVWDYDKRGTDTGVYGDY